MPEATKYKEKVVGLKRNNVVRRAARFLVRCPKRLRVESVTRQGKTMEVTTRLFTGDDFHVVLPDLVSRSVYLSGVFEPNDTLGVMSLLREGDTFFDIGAHIGYYSVIASKLVGASGRVAAFEPTPSTFALLQRNLAKFSQARACNCALSSENGVATFNDYGLKYLVFNSFNAPRLEKPDIKAQQIQVKTQTLDDYVAQEHLSPTFIKVDAESAELAILHGSQATMRDLKPKWLIEVGDFDHIDSRSTHSIIEFLQSFGYSAFEFDGEKFVRHMLRTDAYPSMNLYFAHEDLSAGSPSKYATHASKDTR